MSEHSICPLCANCASEIKKTFEVDVLVRAWAQTYGLDIKDEFGGVTQLVMRQCSVCALQYFKPESTAGSSALYEKLEKLDWYYLPQKWEYEVAMADLMNVQRVMEVGCGSGAFILYARGKSGLLVQGLEMNVKAAQVARGRGLEVRDLTVEEAAEEFAGQFDAVCSFQVLEHVPNPGEFLRACCKLVRPGGRLLFGVPNASSHIRLGFNILDMPPHHMSRWKKDVLSKIPLFYPLRLLHLRYEPLAEYHVDYYVYDYCNFLARGPLKPLNHPAVRSIMSRILRTGVRRWLLGQTVYACYERS